MARRVDEKKLLQWQERLGEFEASGLSVAAFCRGQKMSPTQFYYWLRRVREAGSVVGNAQKISHACRLSSHSREDLASDEVVDQARVEIFIGKSVRVSLPTSAPTLISSVLQRLQGTTEQSTTEQAYGFELVDVVSGR